MGSCAAPLAKGAISLSPPDFCNSAGFHGKAAGYSSCCGDIDFAITILPMAAPHFFMLS
jgi:hypothetical protein